MPHSSFLENHQPRGDHLGEPRAPRVEPAAASHADHHPHHTHSRYLLCHDLRSELLEKTGAPLVLFVIFVVCMVLFVLHVLFNIFIV